MGNSFKITNVSIFNGEDFHVGDVIVKDGVIVASNESFDSTVDGTSKFLIPGLVDCHIHVKGEASLRGLADHGVTTALDMGAWPMSSVDEVRNRTGLPDIRSAGCPATVEGTFHHRMLQQDDCLVTSVSQVDEWVLKRIKDGSDHIKVISDIPGPSQELLDALVTSAHKHGKKIVAHAMARVPFEMAIQAGVDFITHLPLDEPLGEDMARRMKAAGLVAIPTLAVDHLLPTKLDGKLSYTPARTSLQVLHDAGVKILAGTDSNTSDFCPVKFGATIHEEMRLMVEGGLSPLEALQSATELTRCFGMEDRGRIESGLRADLVLLNKNPLENIENTWSVEKTWIGGQEYVRT